MLGGMERHADEPPDERVEEEEQHEAMPRQVVGVKAVRLPGDGGLTAGGNRGGVGGGVPPAVRELGEDAGHAFVEFFTAQIRNSNTRAAYYRNAVRYCDWLEAKGVGLPSVRPVHVAAYIEELGTTHAPPSVKQHLATLRMLGQFLVLKQILRENPAAGVRGPRHVVRVGKTPVLQAADVRRLFASMQGATPSDVRDRALFAVQLYTFARVSAVLNLRRGDYFRVGSRMVLRFREKGGRDHEMPVHHTAIEYLDRYLELLDRLSPGGTDGAELMEGQERVEEGEEAKPYKNGFTLFQSLNRKRTGFTGRPLGRREALDVWKRRCRRAGLGDRYGNHTPRATGITAYLSNGGLLEHAQRMAGHASSQTTKVYDRRDQVVTLDEVERIVF